MTRPRVAGGVLHLGGQRRLLLSGEYPYYRDTPRLWPAKLAALRTAGLEVVSFYVPWRHHEQSGDGSFNFAGPGNLDLVGFLAAIRRAGLLALAKPGPHVHAELPIGGLPHRVSPSVDPARTAALNAAGEPLLAQRFALPSVADPAFAGDAAAWLRAVGDVLRPWQYPDGPLIAVQVGNEGSYGETALPIDGYDYSGPALAAFRRWAGGTQPPRSWVPSSTVDDLLPYLRWGRWLTDCLQETLRRYVDHLALDVPAFANISPPARSDRHPPARAPGRYDAWFIRGLPRRAAEGASPVPHYAYTSWTGDAAREDEALINYVLAARRRRGPNLEENWSLSWAAPDGQRPATSIFHTLLGLACGSTGINVYTACATAHWGPHLAVDRGFLRDSVGDPAQLDPPYGADAPIDQTGRPAPGFAALRVLTHFLAAEGPRITAATPEPGIRWYGYHPYAAINAWRPAMAEVDRGHPVPPSSLVPFLTHCLSAGLPFSLHEFDDLAPTYDELAPVDGGPGPVVTDLGSFMAETAQRQLARLVTGGRAVLLVGQVPEVGEHGQPCTVLADALRAAGDGRTLVPPVEFAGKPGEWLAGLIVTSGGDLPRRGWDQDRPYRLDLRLVGPDGTIVFLFNRRARAQRVRVPVDGADLAVRLRGYGCAAIRLAHGRVAAAYVHGLDDRTGDGEPVVVEYGADRIASTRPCDLSVVAAGDGYAVHHTGGPDNHITVPDRHPGEA